MPQQEKHNAGTPKGYTYLPISELLAKLKQENFPIGVGSYIAVQQLLAQLDPNTDPNTVRELLCPLLASDPEQQARFDEIFEELARPEPPPETEEAEIVSPVRNLLENHKQYFRMAALLLVFLSVTAFLYSVINPAQDADDNATQANEQVEDLVNTPPGETAEGSTGTTNTDPPPNTQNRDSTQTANVDLMIANFNDPNFPREIIPEEWQRPVETGRWGLLLFGITLLALYELHRWRRRQLVVRYQEGKKPPLAWPIRFKEIQLRLDEQFYSAAQQYRRRLAGKSHRLNMPATVNATVRNAGAVQLVYHPTTRPAEYLVLIDQSYARNHQSRLFAWIAQSLQKNDVYLEQFYYDGDPSHCWNETHPDGLTLEALSLLYGDYRVIVFGSGAGFIDPHSGRLGSWTEAFSRWEDRAVLTPRPLSFWDVNELRLSELFLVLPATAAGMAELVGQLAESDPQDLAAYLDDPRRYDPGIDLNASPEMVIRQMKRVFRPNGDPGPDDPPDLLTWIAACAMYPELFWDLTLFIGETLSDPDQPLLTQDNLLQLSRLAWFQAGRMPEEFRRRLLFDKDILPERQRQRVAAALGELLKDNLPPDKNTLAFDQRRMHIIISELLLDRRGEEQRQLLEELQQLREASESEDHVALSLLEGQQATPLDYKLPDVLRKYFSGGSAWRQFLRSATVLSLLAGAFFLLPAFFQQPVLKVFGERRVVHFSVAFSPDGKRLVSGGSDNTVRLWGVETGEELLQFSGHTDDVVSVAFSPDGKRLASGGRDNTVRLWGVEAGEELLQLSGHTDDVVSVAFSPDGKRLASGGRDNTVRLWDVETGEELLQFSGHTDDVVSVAFSLDGKRLASGGRDNTVRLWDVETGEELLQFSGHTDDVVSVAFSPDGKRLVSSGSDNTVGLWGVETGEELLQFSGHTNDLVSIAFSPDGKRLASGGRDNTVRLWDVETGEELLQFSGHISFVYSVAFSPDGKRLASGGRDNTVRLWDVETGEELLQFSDHTNDVVSVALSPDGKHLASGSWDKTVRLWDVETGEELLQFSGHTDDVESVAFSPDGKRLASGGRDNTVRLWDVETGEELLQFSGHIDDVVSLAFSPDGKRLASGGRANKMRLWDVERGEEVLQFSDGSSFVESVAFSPDGKHLASGSWDNTVRLWDVETGEELLQFSGHTFPVFSVAFSPDGKRLASGSWANTVHLWDVETGVELLRFSGHTNSAVCVAFSPDGKNLASGSWDNTLRIWDVATGKELLQFSGHTNSAEYVAFSSDGKRLASGSWDNTINLYTQEKLPLAIKQYKPQLAERLFGAENFRIIPAGKNNKLENISSFQLGTYEVRQKEWEAIMGNNPAHFKSPNFPVENVSWNEVQTFLQRLNNYSEDATYRLPTATEWEYAALAYINTNDVETVFFYDLENSAIDTILNSRVWYNSTANQQSRPVGKKQPNKWGLHDVLGNVAELCDTSGLSPNIDSSGTLTWPLARGGSWADSGSVVYEALYGDTAVIFGLNQRSNRVGFRLVRVPRERSWQELGNAFATHPALPGALASLLVIAFYLGLVRVQSRGEDEVRSGILRWINAMFFTPIRRILNYSVRILLIIPFNKIRNLNPKYLFPALIVFLGLCSYFLLTSWQSDRDSGRIEGRIASLEQAYTAFKKNHSPTLQQMPAPPDAIQFLNILEASNAALRKKDYKQADALIDSANTAFLQWKQQLEVLIALRNNDQTFLRNNIRSIWLREVQALKKKAHEIHSEVDLMTPEQLAFMNTLPFEDLAQEVNRIVNTVFWKIHTATTSRLESYQNSGSDAEGNQEIFQSPLRWSTELHQNALTKIGERQDPTIVRKGFENANLALEILGELSEKLQLFQPQSSPD